MFPLLIFFSVILLVQQHLVETSSLEKSAGMLFVVVKSRGAVQRHQKETSPARFAEQATPSSLEKQSSTQCVHYFGRLLFPCTVFHFRQSGYSSPLLQQVVY